MVPGPIFWRELIVTSRRRGTYVDRATVAGLVLLLIVGSAVVNDWIGVDRTTLAGMTRFTRGTFALVVGILTALTLGMIPAEVAPGVAGERDRKSLDALLATRLSAAEVVAGSLAAALVKQVSGLAVGFSVVVLMIPFAGIDPRLVLLAFAGIASTAYATGAIAVVVSVHAKSARMAVGGSALVIWLGWSAMPILGVVLLPRVWPAVGAWVYPVALRLLDSNPLGVLLNQTGPFRRVGFVDAVARMIAYQVLCGSALVAWAIWRLRPASRALYDGEGRSVLRALRRTRWRDRPPCGDDPVLWNEKYASRGMSRWQWLLGVVVNLWLVALFTWFTYALAKPAFLEVVAFGYTAAPAPPPSSPGVPLFARAIVRSASSGPGLNALPAGQARHEFNSVLRMVTGLFFGVYVLIVAGFGSDAVAAEREKDTWLGLIATPLTGREILRAKMVGSFWRLRLLIGTIITLWSVGLVTGALHPLGFLAAVVCLGVSGWFLVAMGVYLALWSRDRKQATNRVILPTLLLAMSGMVLVLLPSASASILMGVGCMPVIGGVSLLSYEDVLTATWTGEFPCLAEMGLRTGEGAGRVAATFLISLAAQGVLAFAFSRAAFRGFDAAVGRPVRSRSVEAVPPLVVAPT